MTAHFVIILIIAAACRIHCKTDIQHLSVCLFKCIWGYIVIYMWSSIWYMDRLNRFSRGERQLQKSTKFFKDRKNTSLWWKWLCYLSLKRATAVADIQLVDIKNYNLFENSDVILISVHDYE